MVTKKITLINHLIDTFLLTISYFPVKKVDLVFVRSHDNLDAHIIRF